MRLPTFIIFGAIKSGTGALHQYLSHHPQIYASPMKEPRFFSAPPLEDSSGTSGSIRTLEDYASVFEGAVDESAVGEASSGYIYSPHAARRIKETLPNVRLIASLRSPIDRAIAHLHMSGGALPSSLSDLDAARETGWADGSRYYKHLAPYYDLFEASQLKVVILEEWTRNVNAALRSIYDFLEVDTSFELPDHIRYPAGQVIRAQRWRTTKRFKRFIPEPAKAFINRVRASRPNAPRVDPDVRSLLCDWYRDDVRQLEKLLDRDLSVWSINERPQL